MKEVFDVIILGAGPAGCAAAIGLHGSGLKVALLDKSTFPRDKICGDAISPDVINQLGKLPIDLTEAFLGLEHTTVCNAVRFISADYSHADIKLYSEGISGYITPRLDFDAFMFAQAKRSDAVSPFLEVSVEHIACSKDEVEVKLKDGRTLHSHMILGADGAQSMVKRSLHQGEKPDRNHYCAGLRMYYEGVTGFSEDNAIELHFYKELLPGYFWIFPLPNGRANVGIGMLTSFIQKNRINLKQELLQIIKEHPNVADRFKDARPLENPQGFPLPLGSKKRRISGDRYLLLGDAASLINPLSGEGIANAVRSGRVAAEHLIEAFNKRRFDAAFNKKYDKEVYRRMWGELRLNYWVQRFMRNPSRSNWLVKHAITHPLVKELVMSGFDAKNIFKRATSR